MPENMSETEPKNGSSSTGIHFEALEPRLLLSATGESAAIGAAVPTPQPLAPVAIDADHSEFASQNNALATNLLRSTESSENTWSAEPEPSVNLIGNDQQTGQNTPTTNSVNAVSTDFETGPAATSTLDPVDILANADARPLDMIDARQELVVVDGGIANYEQLVTDLLSNRDDSRQFEVVILDPERDGVAQMSDLLAERQDLDAVHFVTHGTDNAVKLGNQWIRTDNFNTHQDSIAGWKSSLADGADLLFYGCDLADGEDGRALLGAFGSLTGADVAASVDDTGHADYGGDWDLEYEWGGIETKPAFSRNIQQNWSGTLAIVAEDDFESEGYAGGTGWAGPWDEDDQGGATDGDFQVNQLFDSPNWMLQIQGIASESIQRQIDLSGETTAILSFDYARQFNNSGDTVTLQISTDGGNNFTDVQVFNNGIDATWQTFSTDITGYIDNDTIIRFQPDGLSLAAEYMAVDNIQITNSVNSAPQTADVSDSGDEDAASITVTLSGSDVDGTVASFSLSGLPATGRFTRMPV